MEKYLDKCLTSLVIGDKELMRKFEVLVVIDGAKDRSSEIAHSYQDKYYETFCVIDKDNGNYGSCINCGLKKATGKYVKILDADDSFNNKNFTQYLEILSSIHDVDVVFSNYRTIDEAGNTVNEFSRPFKSNTTLTWADVLESLTNRATHTAMHELAFKRQMLLDMQYQQTEGISYTDQEWVFYPFFNVKSFYYIDLVIYNYLIGRTGQTMDFAVITKGIPDHITIGYRMLEWLDKIPTNVESYRYLHAAILWFMTHIYTLCLTCNEKGINLSDLVKLDKRIKKVNNSLYEELGRNTIYVMKLFNVHYVRWWRGRKNMNTLPLKGKLLVRYLTCRR